MSPYQHGEVYVTEDGAETDLDLGHYERFIDEDLNRYSNLTTGKVYWNVLEQGAPRRIPRLDRSGHSPHHKRDQGVHLSASANRPTRTSSSPKSAARSAISRSQPFLEAIRQVALEVGQRKQPVHSRHSRAVSSAARTSTSPSPRSTPSRSCRAWASTPDIIVLRCDEPLEDSIFKKDCAVLQRKARLRHRKHHAARALRSAAYA